MNAKFLTLMTSLLLMSCLGLARAEKMTPPKLNGAACGQCHGNVEKGIDSSVPGLAGQNTAYLIQQINAFLKGDRKHPVLWPSNKKTSKTQIENLATYYSGLEVKHVDLEQIYISPSGLFSQSFIQLIKQGESIYASCSGCHGMEAEGIAPYPKLAGQQSNYLKQQLRHFKTGKRDNNLMQMMTVNLSDEDINALALYLSTLGNMALQVPALSQQ